MQSYRLVVLSSGTGTNLQNLIEFAARSGGRIAIAAVFSDQRSRSLQRAQHAGIDDRFVPAHGFADRAAYDAALADAIHALRPDLIVLSGFMRILTGSFVSRFRDRIINIHPSLLPRFPGLNTHRRVIEAGDRAHGATVHFVTEELDAGPAIIQCRIPVRESDDEHSLAARVHQVEYRIFPLAVSWCAEGRVTFKDGAAHFDGMPLASPVTVTHAD